MKFLKLTLLFSIIILVIISFSCENQGGRKTIDKIDIPPEQIDKELSNFIEEFSTFIKNEPEHGLEILRLRETFINLALLDSLKSISNNIAFSKERFSRLTCNGLLFYGEKECVEQSPLNSRNTEQYFICLEILAKEVERCKSLIVRHKDEDRLNPNELIKPVKDIEKAPQRIVSQYVELNSAYISIRKILNNTELNPDDEAKKIRDIIKKLKEKNMFLKL